MTDKQKQIEEMAKLACSVFDGNCMGCSFAVYPPCPPKASAERLYNAGYRKQRVWISVKERLPEQKVMVLGFCHTEGDNEGYNDRILVMELNRLGQFMPFNCSPIKDNSVTHWMPLPEPPKMKEGDT